MTAGSTPLLGPLAQLAEQGTLNPKVGGSIPPRPTSKSEKGRARGDDHSVGGGDMSEAESFATATAVADFVYLAAFQQLVLERTRR